MDQPAEPPERKKLLFRFSVRGMLLLVVVLAIPIGFLSHGARLQREAVQTIESAGGTVFYDYHQIAPRTVSTGGQPWGPQWARERLGYHYFDTAVKVRLHLHDRPQGLEWVAALNDLPSLNTLLLTGVNVTDEMLEQLDRSAALLELHLSGGRITDRGLENVAKFPNLRWLVMNHTQVSDAGVTHLRELHDLQELVLSDTMVSDQAIADLTALERLQKLDLRRTAISAEGIQAIQAALPGCQVLD